jgi:predicted RNase H-like HicB family nuclease
MKYAVVIEKGFDSYGAYAPDLPGCSAVGESRKEVLKLIQEAVRLHLQSLQEQGAQIPVAASSFEIIDAEPDFAEDFLADREDGPPQERDFS